MMNTFIRWCGGVGAGLLLASMVHADVTFSDTEFADADWTANTVQAVPSGTSTGAQMTGGNPGFGRAVTNTLTQPALIYGLHTYGTTPATMYDPFVSGAIGSVDFAIDAKWLSGIGGQGEGVLLGAMQGANMYRFGSAISGSTGLWEHVAYTGVTGADFIELSGGAPIDFSASAAPIRFGFAVSNWAPDQSYFNVVLFDNWTVTVRSVPAPGACAAMLGLSGLVAARRRRAT